MDRLLSQLADTVAGAEDLEGLTRPLLELLQAVTGMESAYLTRIDEAAGQQHIVFARNTRRLQIPEGLSVPWGDTLCKRALEEARPYTDDVAGCWGDSDAARALGIRTYLSQPVRYGDGQLYGTLCAASAERKPVPAEALKILGMFARILTLQVDRERRLLALRAANAALNERVHTDPLTGIPNRRALNKALARTLTRARRTGGSVQVAFVDLDGFKAINDRNGHAAGDRFLKLIGGRLSAATRRSETIARYGGDEFVLVAEGANPDELRDRLERVLAGRYDLGTAAIDYAGASVGVVEARSGENAEALLKRADAAMYSIKQLRRAATA
jgi:diguanylate cyclase